MRERMLWIGIGVLSLLLAAALGLATSRLTEAPVGLTAEPVSADEALAPTPARTPDATPTPTPTPKKKKRRPTPTPAPTAAPTAVPTPTPAPVSPSSGVDDGSGDDNSGHGSDDSGGDDNSGHGRSGDDD